MGDRCWLRMTIRAEDEEVVREYLEEPDTRYEADDLPDGLELTWDEANYAYLGEREALARAGVPFVGVHTAGGEYGPTAFASASGWMSEVDTDHHDDPVFGITPDSIDADGRVAVPAHVRCFFTEQEEALRLLATTGPTPAMAALALGHWLKYAPGDRWRGQGEVTEIVADLCAWFGYQRLDYRRLPDPDNAEQCALYLRQAEEQAARYAAAAAEMERERRERELGQQGTV